ncbi:hypothetical protein GCM10025868_11270 [Angustibacter aerolatus]|uniref:UvrD-like helicase C-terminal domain-containing protein n=1 Tax=Angustibacter aerolatus TaxID=1162965 RepID=A0ABQ6JG26_9ACTN|nr:hypothetical protein GCM10025868_11270 [Angustibacter aerolatus]
MSTSAKRLTNDVADIDTRKYLSEALIWCLDRLRDGLSPIAIRDRIKIGDQETLLNSPGLHLLSSHLGKGQQFDWVLIVGAEDGVIPDWRSSTDAQVLEEARVLSVMVSRARHGVVVLHAQRVADARGRVRSKAVTRFMNHMQTAPLLNRNEVAGYLRDLDWSAVAAS